MLLVNDQQHPKAWCPPQMFHFHGQINKDSNQQNSIIPFIYFRYKYRLNLYNDKAHLYIPDKIKIYPP